MPTKVLLIGTGSIANRHAVVLKKIKDARVVGVCDVRQDAAEEFNRRHKLRAAVFSDAADAIAECDLDAVILLTPRGVRKKLIELCIAHNLPVMLEKPPCHDLAVGREILAMIQTAGLIHSVAFPTRYTEDLAELRSQIAKERLALLTITVETPMATNPCYDAAPDPYLVERSGGLVGDQGIHYVDIARYLAGEEVQSIRAYGTNRVLPKSDKVTTCDTAGWVMAFDNGVVATHAHTWGGAGWACNIHLVTDRSRVTVDGFTGRATGTLDGKPFDFTPADASVERAFELEHRAFLEAIRSGSMAPIRSTYADALKSFAAAEEIIRQIHNPEH
jgi:predicted dehydrogenase